MQQWSYFIDTHAHVWEALIDLSRASWIYRRVLPWLNNEQSTELPAQTSLGVEKLRQYPASGIGEAILQLFRVKDMGTAIPGAEYEGGTLSLDDKVLYYDEADPNQVNHLTQYDIGYHVSDWMMGRILMDSGEEGKIKGYVSIRNGDVGSSVEEMENKAFFAMDDAELKSQFSTGARFPFLGVNPRYFIMDAFKGYKVEHEPERRPHPATGEMPFGCMYRGG